jgi:5-methylcytosine-specific restriction enzyme subunit McrC
VPTRSDLAALSEGQVVSGVDLTRAEAVALNAAKLVSVQPTVDGWIVTAAHTVGALRCGHFHVRVQPKVGTIQALRLLARAHGVRDLSLDQQTIEVIRDQDLTTVLAALFAQEAASAMAEGPLRGYRSEDQSLAVVRGRLRLKEQYLRRFGQLVPLEVTVDEWTLDTDENRRVRAAGQRLLALPELPPLVRRRLLRLDRQLAEVTSLPLGAPVPPWMPTRLNAKMHAILRLADLVLANQAVEHRVGDVRVSGFTLSMALLFERLVTRVLWESGSEVRVVGQRQSDLDATGVLKIKPDLVFLAGRSVVGVADVKYKLLDENGKFPNADAYQLITYCSRLGLDVGHLIYAAGDPCPEPLQILGSGVRLVIHAVDLGRSVSDIEQAVRTLASDTFPTTHLAS